MDAECEARSVLDMSARISAREDDSVEVHHPKAHVTHEASIGSLDNKQFETLMSRGLTEDEATDLIIEGLLSPTI